MSHRFEFNVPIVNKVLSIMPEGPFVGHKADALIAALSKLPLEQVDRGFQILLSTLNGQHPTVMGALRHFVSLLNDVLSEARLYQGQHLKAEWIQNAFQKS